MIAFFGLRKNVTDLAKGAANLKDLLGKGGDIATLMDRLIEVKKEAAEMKAMLEAISIKDKSKELQELAASATATAQLGIEDMFDKIRVEWSAVGDQIRRIAMASGVQANLIGNVGVSETVDELVRTGATQRAAELTKALSRQWQWMFRTTSPKEQWLTPSVFTSFLDGAAQAKSAMVAQ